MSYGDLLLQWVSCFSELRVARIQAAAGRLCAPPVTLDRDDPRRAKYLGIARRLTRNLLRVGHVEELTKERYRTVPPTVVSCPGNRYLLIGARSNSLLSDLAKVNSVTVSPATAQEWAPSAFYLTGNEESVAAVCEKLNITLIPERWGAVLSSLPALSEVLVGAPADGIPDRIERWNPKAPAGRSRWARATIASDAPGLFRTIRKPYQWYLRLAPGEETLRLDTPERRSAAAWRMLQGRARVIYDTSRQVLSIPAVGFSLPLLVDRGLIMSSGRLPVRQHQHWDYFEVDSKRAYDVARILGMKLEHMQ